MDIMSVKEAEEAENEFVKGIFCEVIPLRHR